MPEKNLYTVLVADDEDELREAVCRMVPWGKLGFQLVGDASNGLDALELVEQLEPDLLLTDIRMPFISGIDLARQVREIRPSMHIAFLSGYDDFEYAKQAIQYNIISYMLKPLTMEGLARELGEIHAKMDAQNRAYLEQNQQADREAFLLPLLLDEYAAPCPEEQLLAAAQQSGLLQGAADRPRFVVMVSSLMTPGGAGAPAAVRTVGMIAEKYLRHRDFYVGGKVVTVLMGTPADFEEYLHILTSELVQVAERVLHRRCSVGVSRETARLGELHQAYREAVEATSYFEQGEGGVRFLSDLQPMTATHADAMTAMVAGVEAAFKSSSREELGAELERMLTAAHEAGYGKDWLDMAALQLVADVYRITYSTAGSEAMTELQNRDILPDLGFRYRTNSELKASLMEFCTCAMELMTTQQKKGGNQLCRRALEAIDQNYGDESLSLVSLSGVLDVSPNHLSACIKKYAGESFINILIQRRMDTARELLVNTPLKIAEIAQRCGYSDQHYFSYCFKKYSGVSPNMLRRQNQAEKEGPQ